MDHLGSILLLLAVTIAVVVTFQRLHVPTSLGYLLVGIILGPHTIGYTVSVPELTILAEFGVVFLLFAIGLNYSIPQLAAMRHQVLLLGTGQVVLTTLLVAIACWLAGLPAAAAFVLGAVFAQSSTTIMASLLTELREENAQHGRFALAMSVFQDVTAVPFIIIIPVLGSALVADVLLTTLGWALAKAILALLLVIMLGRWLLRPLFHLVSERRSMEMFTLAVLLVALLSAWTTHSLGLSLAFGGFLAGMMLGETEFRHQVESSIRPFRDVLLGLFFIGIGMRFDPSTLPAIWPWAIMGALLLLTSKTLIVVMMLRHARAEKAVAWRTGLLLSVGGEFGLALVAIALDAHVINTVLGQIAITSVLLSMMLGALLIRFNGPLVDKIVPTPSTDTTSDPILLANQTPFQVIIGGYGRVGHTMAVLLHASGIPFLIFDRDTKRVSHGRDIDRHPVFYGDISDPELLAAIHVERAALVVITIDDSDTALSTIAYLQRVCPQVPVVARARDLETSTLLLEAGALQAYPELIEASLHLGETALQLLNIPDSQIHQVLQNVRESGYQSVQEDGVE
ncbi:cation:proton antiporter [Aeromonas australiensis]|uniref:cation:proton antiporter n=1 Tax=Aeromonas australiensis TaxID=1114880 RepID=UPI001F4905E3|nr:cation:proton antiporter [Aeromonas australiensis]